MAGWFYKPVFRYIFLARFCVTDFKRRTTTTTKPRKKTIKTRQHSWERKRTTKSREEKEKKLETKWGNRTLPNAQTRQIVVVFNRNCTNTNRYGQTQPNNRLTTTQVFRFWYSLSKKKNKKCWLQQYSHVESVAAGEFLVLFLKEKHFFLCFLLFFFGFF